MYTLTFCRSRNGGPALCSWFAKFDYHLLVAANHLTVHELDFQNRAVNKQLWLNFDSEAHLALVSR